MVVRVVFEMLVVVMLVGMLITENICIAPECTSGTVLSTSQILTQRSKSSGSYCLSSHFTEKENISCCALETGLQHRVTTSILQNTSPGDTGQSAEHLPCKHKT